MHEFGMQDIKDDPRLQGAPRERTGVVARSQLLGHLVSSSASCISHLCLANCSSFSQGSWGCFCRQPCTCTYTQQPVPQLPAKIGAWSSSLQQTMQRHSTCWTCHMPQPEPKTFTAEQCAAARQSRAGLGMCCKTTFRNTPGPMQPNC